MREASNMGDPLVVWADECSEARSIFLEKIRATQGAMTLRAVFGAGLMVLE